jgi:hypothetical protein
MKIALTSLALGAGLAVAAPALAAADQVATGQPTQLAQKAGKQKAKHVKADAKKAATKAKTKPQ